MQVELKAVSMRAGDDTIIHPTSLSFHPGGFNILLGATLAGKTTLLRLLAGLTRPDSGEVWFDGKDVTALPVRRRGIAMVYQQFINYPNWRVYDNIASPLKVQRLSAAETARRVAEVCELLRLTPLLERHPHELSGGQQQRIALARALVKQARLVLLDEPLANLDYKLREELRGELPELFKARGTTVVYATTEPMDALLLGGHTAAMHEGKVWQFGETAAVFRHPANHTVARTFSDPPLNCADIVKRDGHFELDESARWPVPPAQRDLPDGRYVLGFRPHHLVPEADGGGLLQLHGELSISELTGSDSLLHFSVNGHHWVAQWHGVHQLKAGTRTRLSLDPRRCFVFDRSGLTVPA